MTSSCVNGIHKDNKKVHHNVVISFGVYSHATTFRYLDLLFLFLFEFQWLAAMKKKLFGPTTHPSE